MEERKQNDPSSAGKAATTRPRGGHPATRATGIIPDFSLCAALVGHTGDVRSLAAGVGYLYSGARDNTVKAWKLDENGHIEGVHKAAEAEAQLPDWVNALTVRPSFSTSTLRVPAARELVVGVTFGGPKKEEEEEVVVAGCKDGGIYALGWHGGAGKGGETSNVPRKLVVTKTLLGHDAPICSLSWSIEGLLLSGSWDETARGWDLETGECKWVLGGHENNVCVLGLGVGSVATGSTGLEVAGRLVGQQIRMWEGSPLKEVRSLTEHKSGIRGLCETAVIAKKSSCEGPEPAFCSCSNDGRVRSWNAEGDCLGVFAIPDSSFVFSVRCLGNGLVATGDDAGNLSALRLQDATAETPQQSATLVFNHPKTVWSLAALPGKESWAGNEGPSVADVATGSADGMIRVFTPDSSRALHGDELVEVEEALRYGGDGSAVTTLPSSAGSFGLGFGAGLPMVSEMGVMVGEVDGQLSAFADDETGGAKIFRWKEALRTGGGVGWEVVGSLRPPVRKVAFEGSLYDQVVPVEVESASRGFLSLQMGINRGDNPTTVASVFCEKHCLGPEYVPQIEQFVAMVALMS